MTTNTYSSVIAHTSDATFRAWGSALAASMQAAGLVQTADTGQINWASVTRPAINTAAGYEIYRFNDSLQGSFPIFFKIEYGTANLAASPQVWITVATGSNGSGTLTGQSSTRNATGSNSALNSTVTAYPTYVCVKNGFLGVQFKLGGGPTITCPIYFMVGRTTDDAGAETGDGFTVFRRPQSNTGGLAQSVSVANATTFTESAYYGIVHMEVTSTLVGTDKQVYKTYTVQPRVRPVLQMCMALVSEYPAATSFTTTLVGAASRTYLSGGLGTCSCGPHASTNYCLAMLYE